MYLYAMIFGNGPVTAIGTWSNGVVYPDVLSGSEPTSQSLGGYVSFGEAVEYAADKVGRSRRERASDTPAFFCWRGGGRRGANNVVEVRAGLSFVDMAHADRNMETMINHRPFEAVLDFTTELWQRELSIINVSVRSCSLPEFPSPFPVPQPLLQVGSRPPALLNLPPCFV